jgi:hypothetical protein
VRCLGGVSYTPHLAPSKTPHLPSKPASRPLRSQVEPTSNPPGSKKLENAEKTGPEAALEVAWATRKHRTCRQIGPRGHFEASAIKSGLKATSKPLRAHFETTWLEHIRKHQENQPRSHFRSHLDRSKTPHLPSNPALRPLWNHFEPTSRPPGLKTLLNTGLEATFEVTWTARKHRTCHQIRPRSSETYVRSGTHVHSNTHVRSNKETFRETSSRKLSWNHITSFTSLCFASLRALHARVHTSIYIYICVYILHIIQISSRH